MADELRFDDRVVIVTGAGGGLGRSHALLFASRGAKLVVNDLGGSMHGGGASSKAADEVVKEICDAGGTAVANYDSVEDGDKIVQAALDSFGRIDVVVNNAGILRDVSFHKMTLDDWDKIYRVHVYGGFRVSHAAWPHMRDQGYGRIIMTASAAGIYGNFGQANYSMAKLGLVGLANTLAVEGHRKGVLVNTIAPIAGSRLTETVLPPEIINALKPEYVSPLVAWLCHESCDETGGLFEVGGGFFAKLRWQRAKGELIRLGKPMSIERIQRSFKTITNFADAAAPRDITQSMGPVMENIQAGPAKGGNDLVDVDLALGYEYPEQTSSYDERDLAIYALGVGAAADPLNDQELQLVYEMHGKGFRALPSFGVIPAMNGIMQLAKEGHNAPGLNYGLDRLLHGEQYTEVMRPLPPKATLTHRARIKDIWDKQKGAIIVTETKSYDEQGELLIVNEFISFIRGAGGWGGERGPSAEINNPPERAADVVSEQSIGQDQALLYRLSGDWNPLHADPSFAQAFGFERPILHGLCTFGYATRHVINAFAGGDPRLFKSIKVRFASSVFPGETLITEMWKEADGRIIFRCKVKERDKVVISNAAIELYREIPKPKEKAKPAAPAQSAAANKPETPSSADIFTAIGQFLSQSPEVVAKVARVFQFKLTAPDSVWTVDAKTGCAARGTEPKPDCTLELSDDDFLGMSSGKLDPQKLYFGGLLKISGDVMASQKLSFLKKLQPEQVMKAMHARLQAEGGGSTASSQAASSDGADAATPNASSSAAAKPPARSDKPAQAPQIIEALREYLASHPEAGQRVTGTVQLSIREPSGHFTLAAGETDGSIEVALGSASDATATLTLSDADFGAWARGETSAQALFQRGALAVDGDINLARQLDFIGGLLRA